MNDLVLKENTELATSQLTENDLVDAALSTLERATVLRVPRAREVSEQLAEIQGRPLSDRILVLPLPPDERFGQVLIPDTAQQDQQCGIVVAVGRGRYENGVLIAPEVKAGNYVMFSKFAQRTLKIGDIEVFQITEADINFAAGG